MVGTSTGTVHRQQQGTGLATVLQGGVADAAVARRGLMGKQEAAARAAARQASQAATQKKRDDAVEKLRNYAPEYWYRHKAELSKEIDEWKMQGAALMNDGVQDPFTATDPASLEWQKRAAKISQMAQSSMQIKSDWEKLRDKISGSDPDKWMAEDVIAATEFPERFTLGEIVEKNMAVPMLREKRPLMSSIKFINEQMTAAQQKYGDQEIPDKDIPEMVGRWFQDPAFRDDLVSTYSSRIAQMDPTEQQMLERQAAQAGYQPFAFLAVEDAIAAKKRGKPVDYFGEFAEAAKTVETQMGQVTVDTPDKTWEGPRKGEENVMSQTAAKLKFQSNPQAWLAWGEQNVPRADGDTDEEYRKDIIAVMASQIKTLVSPDTKSVTKDAGQAKKEYQAGMERWVKDVQEGDLSTANMAIGRLRGEKFAGNLNIVEAAIVPKEQEKAMVGGQFNPEFNDSQNVLKLVVSTPLSKDEVESTAYKEGRAMTTTSTEWAAGKQVIYVPIGSKRSDTLLSSLYQQNKTDIYKGQISHKVARDAPTQNNSQQAPVPATGAKRKIYE